MIRWREVQRNEGGGGGEGVETVISGMLWRDLRWTNKEKQVEEGRRARDRER